MTSFFIFSDNGWASSQVRRFWSVVVATLMPPVSISTEYLAFAAEPGAKDSGEDKSFVDGDGQWQVKPGIWSATRLLCAVPSNMARLEPATVAVTSRP